jgi:hypothetical protein
MEQIANSTQFGVNKIGYDYIYDFIRKDRIINKEISKGYWFAMSKKPIEETRNMTFEEQRDYIEANFPKEYGFPTTDQALIYYLMHRARYGSCNLSQNTSRTAYTRCVEKVDGGNVIVGSAAPSGLSLFNFSGAFPNISIILTRNFD